MDRLDNYYDVINFRGKIIIELKGNTYDFPKGLIRHILNDVKNIHTFKVPRTAKLQIADFLRLTETDISVIRLGAGLLIPTSGHEDFMKCFESSMTVPVKQRVIFPMKEVGEIVKNLIFLFEDLVIGSYEFQVNLGELHLLEPFISKNEHLKKLTLYESYPFFTEDTPKWFDFLRGAPPGMELVLCTEFLAKKLLEGLEHICLLRRIYVNIKKAKEFSKKTVKRMISKGIITGLPSNMNANRKFQKDIFCGSFSAFLDLRTTNIETIMFEKLDEQFFKHVVPLGIFRNLETLHVEYMYLEDLINLSNLHEKFPKLRKVKVKEMHCGYPWNESTIVLNPKTRLTFFSTRQFSYYMEDDLRKLVQNSINNGMNLRVDDFNDHRCGPGRYGFIIHIGPSIWA